MVKHTETVHRLLATKYLSMFDHFVGLALIGLKIFLVWGVFCRYLLNLLHYVSSGNMSL